MEETLEDAGINIGDRLLPSWLCVVWCVLFLLVVFGLGFDVLTQLLLQAIFRTSQSCEIC